MLFWIVAAALTVAIAALFGLAMLRRHPAEEDTTASHDMQVYRDQLAEVERDLTRGVLAPAEAERARIEISRRMLEADRQERAGAGLGARAGAAPRGVTIAAFAGVALVLLGAFGGYLTLGIAGYPDQPLAERIASAEELYRSRPTQDEAERRAAATRPALPAPDPQFTELMDKLRSAVAQRPNDPVGLQLLARNEMILGNYTAGWQAQRRLIAVKGDTATAADYAQLGEDMVVAAGGLVTKQAEEVFATALQKDPREGLSLYYIGLMMAQNGRGDRAFRLWDGLMRNTPADAPWQEPIRQNIRQLAWVAGEENYQMPGTGPSAEDMQAAAGLSPEERMEFVRGMVERLNDRLAAQGGPVADWAKLVSSLRMLGEVERANAIATEARGKFAADPAAVKMIDQALAAPAGAVQ
ncbi:c-type cytochrome biogenesis protein CcmI [Paenirhodobacter sp.]|uniref:c-type cytochrome biogenesis protein CcmI n=1 Tax=Paenirhodobacter sp. TaxID=1965326 RepID=UPI003B3BF453